MQRDEAILAELRGLRQELTAMREPGSDWVGRLLAGAAGRPWLVLLVAAGVGLGISRLRSGPR